MTDLSTTSPRPAIGAWLRPAATILAAAGIILVFVNGGLVLRNQASQAVVSQRQQVINTAAPINRIQQMLAQALAQTAVQHRDEAIQTMLERHGFRINIVPTAGAPKPETQPEKKP
jgi:hypothetical protein